MKDEEVCLLATQCTYVFRAILKQTLILSLFKITRLKLVKDEEVCVVPTQCTYVSRAIPKQTAILSLFKDHRLISLLEEYGIFLVVR